MAIYHVLVCCQNIDLIRRLGLIFFTEIHNWQHLSDTCPTADETFQLSSAKSAEYEVVKFDLSGQLKRIFDEGVRTAPAPGADGSVPRLVSGECVQKC